MRKIINYLIEKYVKAKAQFKKDIKKGREDAYKD
tara:strand:- start:621 stop:722 length:102 start_codon:yes stop_codon:yes gene_type:complete